MCEYQAAKESGAYDAIICTHFSHGGKGATELGRAVMNACKDVPSDFKFLYELNKPIKEKIETIASQIYGAAKVDYSQTAERQIATYTRQGFDSLPICMAKTQYSFSDDPNAKVGICVCSTCIEEPSSSHLKMQHENSACNVVNTGCTVRIHAAYPRGTGEHWRWVSLSSYRANAHDSGTAHATSVLRH